MTYRRYSPVHSIRSIFEGTPGTVAITHGNGVTVSALIFQTNGYTLNSIAPERAVNCRSGGITTYVNVASNATATINAIITNGPSANRVLQVGGRGTLVLNGSNMFNGQIIIGNNAPANGTTASFVNGNGNGQTPTVQASIIANLGVASSLGMQASGAKGTIRIGDASTSGILEYIGAGPASTDRKVQVGSSKRERDSAFLDPVAQELDKVIRKKEPRTALIVFQIAVALATIIVGANFFVEHIRQAAIEFAINPMILALIIAPIATELPEKFNSFLWIRQGKDTYALGNITGAMVFQSSIPVTIGIVFTDWHVDLGDTVQIFEALSIGMALVTAVVLYLRSTHKELHVSGLMAGGAMYALFIALVVLAL